MLILRAMPYFPSGILTALGAVSRISLKDYALANLIGKFPSTALEVVIGHDVVNYKNNLRPFNDCNSVSMYYLWCNMVL